MPIGPMLPTLSPPKGIKPIRFGSYLYFFDRESGRSFYLWSPKGAPVPACIWKGPTP